MGVEAFQTLGPKKWEVFGILETCILPMPVAI